MGKTRTCVIGAGPSGITAAKNLLEAGLEVVVYEKSGEVGGNWVYDENQKHSSVYETTHIISSKALSQYLDFPMPDEYAEYPSHSELRQYFNQYTDHFRVRDHICFNTEVQSANLNEDEKWVVTLADQSEEVFDFLLVCNGHHWNPRIPDYPGKFDGEMLHSHQFKHNRPFKGQKVLVIGGGNSACDIAVEISRVTEKVDISMRRGYHFIPKFIMGKPVDTLNLGLNWLPDWIKNLGFKLLLKIAVGDPKEYGLQEPDHPLLGAHPVINSELLYFIKHGRIIPKPDVDHFDGEKVHFTDGSSSKYDTVITATGYVITFPFFDQSFIDFSEGDVPLYKKVFHPEIKNLFFIGLIQPLGCIWPLADLQARMVASYINGEYQLPANLDREVEHEVKRIHDRFMDTPRHSVEVDYHAYRKELLAELPTSIKKAIPAMG